MNLRMKKPILLLLITLVAAVRSGPRVAADVLYTEDEVATAAHCISEASGVRTDDCRVIAWVDMRQAQRRGISVAQFIRTTYTRHTRSASRPWLGGLNAQLTRPDGWPEERIPWEPEGRRRWEEVLQYVRVTLRGERGHGCASGTPLTWGGTMDNNGINRWLARGYRMLSCGRTRNRIIGR